MCSVETRKLVILGNSAVGKSSLALRAAQNRFFEYQETTIGAAFLVMLVSVNRTCKIRFEIWDTAGQEKYHSLAPLYYRGAAAALVVYDPLNQESLKSAQSWYREVRSSGCPCIYMVANKADRLPNESEFTQEGRALCAEMSIQHWTVSAKTGQNVAELFSSMAENVATVNVDDCGGASATPLALETLVQSNPRKRCCLT